MYHFNEVNSQLNAIIIMYELLGRKKRFAMRSYICLKKNQIDSNAKVLKKAS